MYIYYDIKENLFTLQWDYFVYRGKQIANATGHQENQLHGELKERIDTDGENEKQQTKN